MKWLLRIIGRRLAHFLAKPRGAGRPLATSDPQGFARCLQKGDVLLVEGTSRFSSAIKYLTQSSWSHAALYIGDALDADNSEDIERRVLLEADVEDGVRAVPLSEYTNWHCRICRPVGLSPTEIDQLVDYAVQRIGTQYDLKNIIDLLRYLVRTPPVPSRYRRRMLALGSGDPTRAICSSLIAQAFQSVHYPILPERYLRPSAEADCEDCYEEVLRIRHHSLFTPRDFDISPYFRIVKPVIEEGFDPQQLHWEQVIKSPALADPADT
jgi:hypothetical protein